MPGLLCNRAEVEGNPLNDKARGSEYLLRDENTLGAFNVVPPLFYLVSTLDLFKQAAEHFLMRIELSIWFKESRVTRFECLQHALNSHGGYIRHTAVKKGFLTD
eukprot:scpid106328/ scgid28902/ 